MSLKTILLVATIIIVAVTCASISHALNVSQPSHKIVEMSPRYNPQQPASACLQNCTRDLAPANVMGY